MTTIDSSHYVVTSMFISGPPLSGCRVGLSEFDSNGQHITTSYLLYADNVHRRIFALDICASEDSLTISYFGDINGSSTSWTRGLSRVTKEQLPEIFRRSRCYTQLSLSEGFGCALVEVM